MILDCSCWSIIMEGTLGHLGEDLGHRVNPVLHDHDGQDLGAICGKLTTKESVHQVHLADDVDQVQELTKDELVDVKVVFPDVPDDIIDYCRSSVLGCLRFNVKGVDIQILEEEGQLASLPGLPYKVREIAKQCL